MAIRWEPTNSTRGMHFDDSLTVASNPDRHAKKGYVLANVGFSKGKVSANSGVQGGHT